MSVLPPHVSADVTFPVMDDPLYQMMRVFIIWLQGLFQTRPVGDFRWLPELNETEIIITDTEPMDLQVTNKRPQIVVSHSTANFLGTSIGQYSRPNLFNQSATFTDLVGTTLSISFIGKNGVQMKALAWSVFMLIPIFRGNLARLAGLNKIEPQMQIGPVTNTADGQKMVTLTAAVQLQVTFTTDGGVDGGMLFHAVEQNMRVLYGDVRDPADPLAQSTKT